MSAKTEHIGLHQWESTDPFLREYFNEDNRKIDQAVEAVEKQTRQTADSLENMSYNVFNLLLQNYYEDKYTGYKKALIFDGFMDRSRVAAVNDGALISGGAMQVTATGQGDIVIEETSNSVMQKDCSNTVTAEGGGRITGVEATVGNALGESAVLTVEVAASDGQSQAIILTPPDGKQAVLIPLEEPLDVTAGTSVTVSFKGLGGSLSVQSSAENRALPAFTLRCTAVTGTSGSITSTPEEGGSSLHLWARYSGGTLQANAIADSDSLTMELLETYDALTLDGRPCKEAYFRLDRDAESGNLAVQLILNREDADTACLYDYGLILL